MELEKHLMPLSGWLVHRIAKCFFVFFIAAFPLGWKALEEAAGASWSRQSHCCSFECCLSEWHPPLPLVLSAAVCLPDTDFMKHLHCISAPALEVCGGACCAWIAFHVPPISPSNRFTVQRLNDLERNKSESNLHTHNSGKWIRQGSLKCNVEHYYVPLSKPLILFRVSGAPEPIWDWGKGRVHAGRTCKLHAEGPPGIEPGSPSGSPPHSPVEHQLELILKWFFIIPSYAFS